MSGRLDLQISKIFGTSSERSSQVTTQDNLVAYTASGGVVISQINRKTLDVEWQKFYAANSILDRELAYLSASGKLDEYEYPIYPETEVINREGSTTFSRESHETSGTSGISNGSGSGIQHSVHDVSKPIRLRRNHGEEFGNSSSNSNSSLANRVRSINCIAISPDKKLLAVGEVGYQPRIIIYSLAKDSMSIPLMIIQEHQFGINSLSFSPDSKKLCSLGLVNDGFLIVWKLIGRKFVFHGSNKCSSVVNRMIWHDDFIITAGLRNIKIWKESNIETINNLSPSKRSSLIIKGRNVLLKKFLNSNFIDMVVMNYNEVLVLTDQGDLTLINLEEESMVLRKIGNLPSSTNQILVNSIGENLIIAGNKVDILSIDKILTDYNNSQAGEDLNETIKPTPSSPTKIVKRTGVLALRDLFEGERFIYLKDNEELIAVNENDLKDSKEVMNPLLKDIGGLKKCFNEDILIWSKTGLIKRLIGNNELENIHAIVLPNDEVLDNIVTSLDFNGNELVIGDRYGSLYFLQKTQQQQQDDSDFEIKGSKYKETQVIRAHESSINDVIFFECHGNWFCTSVSRDRTVQIFIHSEDKWKLFQTISVHKGNVMKVGFQGNRLFSASSDRTLSIHKFIIDENDNDNDIKIYQEKVISLKSSPSNFTINDNDLVICTTDKTVSVYDFKSLDLKRVLKLYNSHHDSLLIDNVIIDSMRNCLFITASDKSVRCFDFNDGRLLSTSWGHSESILNLIFNDDSLISASTDGCMFIRDILNLDHIPHQSSVDVSLSSQDTVIDNNNNNNNGDEIGNHSNEGGLMRSNTISLTHTPLMKRSSIAGRVERKVLNTGPPKAQTTTTTTTTTSTTTTLRRSNSISAGLSRSPTLRNKNTNVLRTPSTDNKLVSTRSTNLSPKSPTPRTLSRTASSSSSTTTTISPGLSPNTRNSIASRLRSASSSNGDNSILISPKTRSPLIMNKNSANVSSIKNKLTRLTLTEREKNDEKSSNNDLNQQMYELINKLKEFQKNYINEIDDLNDLNTIELSKQLKFTNGLISKFDEEEYLNEFSDKLFDKFNEKLMYYTTVNKENELN